MERHVGNTRKLVEFLAAHPMVESVGYPELPGHPDHALAQRLYPRGCGSVFSFDLKGGRAQGKAFIEALKIFSHLANVGDCRSLVIHPASTTHFRMDDAALAQAGIGQGTIRLSIGLEDADDLRDDLNRALKAAQKAGRSVRDEWQVGGREAYAYTGGKAFDPALPTVVLVHGATRRSQRLGAAEPLARAPRLFGARGRPARARPQRRPGDRQHRGAGRLAARTARRRGASNARCWSATAWAR